MGAIEKADEIDIMLYYKPGGNLFREHFFNQNNDTLLIFVLFVILIKKSHICLLVSQILCTIYKYEAIQIFIITLLSTYHLANTS